MGKYNVAFVDPQSYSNLEKYDLGVISSFKNINLTFYCSNLLETENINNCRVKKIFNYSRLNNSILKVISYLISLFNILCDLWSFNPNIIHIQWSRIVIVDYLFYGLLKIIFPKAKLVFTAHNIRPHNSTEIHFYFYKIIYKLFDLIIVHDNVTKLKLLGIYPNLNIKVIRHGLLPLNDLKGSVGQDISNLDCRDKLSFCFIGRGSHYKGLDLLISAWVKYFSHLNNTQLIIAGKIDSTIDISELASISNVKCIDRFVTDFELQYVLNNSDCCILPYRAISQSGVLLTALAAHLPIIVTNEGGLTQPFEVRDDIGIIIPELKESALRIVMENAIHDKKRIKQLKHDSDLWQDIEDYYSWENISRETQNAYESMFNH